MALPPPELPLLEDELARRRGALLVAFRALCQLSQDELGELWGFQRDALRRWEHGDPRMPPWVEDAIIGQLERRGFGLLWQELRREAGLPIDRPLHLVGVTAARSPAITRRRKRRRSLPPPA